MRYPPLGAESRQAFGTAARLRRFETMLKQLIGPAFPWN
jgi:hypothetical protein